jgi:cell division inhibitor SepF
MSLWKRTMDYLGLGPDDAYDEYDDYDEPEPAPRPRRAPPDSDPRGGRGHVEPESEGVVRTTPARPTFPSRDFDASQARRNAMADDSGVQPRPSRAGGSNGGNANLRSVSPSSSSGEPHTVRPRRFDQAQEVADKFKEGQPVIMNLESADREVSRRLIDFASGICYGLDGSMEKVATGVYLLKPPAVRVARFDDYDD